LAAQVFGYFRRIDRNSDKGRAGGVDFVIMIAKIRQLAEAKRSPGTAIKNQDGWAAHCE